MSQHIVFPATKLELMSCCSNCTKG